MNGVLCWFCVRFCGTAWDDGTCFIGAWVDGRADGIWVDGAWDDGAWVDGFWDDGFWVTGVFAAEFVVEDASCCAFSLMADSSVLSRKSSRISARCDSIVADCSTISSVIRTYEIRNNTVSNGSQVRFFGAGASIAGMVVMAAFGSKVVKMDPYLLPQGRRHIRKCTLSTNGRIAHNQLILRQLTCSGMMASTFGSATRCTF